MTVGGKTIFNAANTFFLNTKSPNKGSAEDTMVTMDLVQMRECPCNRWTLRRHVLEQQQFSHHMVLRLPKQPLCLVGPCSPSLITRYLVLPTLYLTGLVRKYPKLVSNIHGHIVTGKGEGGIICYCVSRTHRWEAKYIRRWAQSSLHNISEASARLLSSSWKTKGRSLK